MFSSYRNVRIGRSSFARGRFFWWRNRPRAKEDRKSTRLNSSHTEIYTLSLHDALPISSKRRLVAAPSSFTRSETNCSNVRIVRLSTGNSRFRPPRCFHLIEMSVSVVHPLHVGDSSGGGIAHVQRKIGRAHV